MLLSQSLTVDPLEYLYVQLRLVLLSFVRDGSRYEFRRWANDESGEDMMLLYDYESRVLGLVDEFDDRLDEFFLPDGY